MTAKRKGPRALLGSARRSPWFALGLLAYSVLTLVAFVLVYRYMRNIAALYGHDIENAWLQYGLLFAIFAALTVVVHAIVAHAPIDITPENGLRLALLAGLTATVIVALYQSRFGADVGLNYFVIAALGTFCAAVDVARRRFGLLEVISEPEEAVLREVERGHAGIALADGYWDRAKRLVELVLALALTIISLPISIPLTFALLLQDPGALLVAKVAVKQGGKSFRQLKLRTMVKNAEVATGPVPAAPEDLRVTWLGEILRRTHIDELPQLINIGLGDMSLVGPRPERTVFVRRHLKEIPRYAERHSVRPGLAGMAQVYGDYYSTPRQKLRYDLLYIRRRSFGLDLKLFGTAVLMALLGVRPGRRRHQRDRHLDNAQEDRWRRAYEALRGEDAPSITPESPPRKAAGHGRLRAGATDRADGHVVGDG